MAKLFIVESPGKIKTLKKILGPGWILEASYGHTTELAQDGHHRWGFELQGERVLPHYVPRGSRGRQVLAKLRKAARQVEQVYLATDPDREGEAIAWHLVEQLKLKNYVRVSYTQITESAVKQALARPLSLDRNLINAQRARQCLDKLVGFEVSPLLWNSKSAGRVQTSTLHLICERERERLAFRPENYWILKCQYGEGFESSSEQIKTEAEAKRITEVARHSPHRVAAFEQKEEDRQPPPPLITSSLQQVAGSRHRYSPKQTMQIAQELYEGVGGKGLITYMRTDAITLSPEFVQEARDWLKQNAPQAMAAQPRTFRMKADAQGAHEAIRPTDAHLTPSQAQEHYHLKPDQANVYRIIWERAMASLCKPARLSKTSIQIECADTRWQAHGMRVLDEGYLHFWKNLEDPTLLPVVRPGQALTFQDVQTEAKTTQPPSRFSEPKLIQLMEKQGIGRPSTYASTISTLKDRDYVVLEKGLLAPTPLGMATDDALRKALPDLVNSAFTAQMERSLDQIAEGQLGWERYLTSWNREYLEPALVKARDALRSVARVADRPTGKFKGKRSAKGKIWRKRRGKKTTPNPAGARFREDHRNPPIAEGCGPRRHR